MMFPAATDHSQDSGITNRKLLIVEDDRAICELYELILEGDDWQLLPPVHNGNEAVEVYDQLGTKPDVVLLDYNLPGQNGLEVAAALRELHPRVRFVVCSAYPSVFKRFAELGGCICLAKPITPPILSRALQLATVRQLH